ncbi:apolipoprotein N-acyltransferase [Shewanella sp. AS16]|uniref:apolipoprotein N-acyltransferase n=1 Tax=Shewanella sp. AS16 TaxID=2907625 RepID=UPI001F3EB5D0|nr:apolipoprotein N-acyltransferase [Shewanella sp. AS16]MCE9686278.1 apolipoprotein N-acyltransferase [Shewanella sp. AS16]
MLNTLRAWSRHTSVRLATAFAVGASTALSFAPYSLWPIYPLALAFALWQSRALSARASGYYWLSFGFGSFALGISWVHVSMAKFGGLPLPVSLGLMALLAAYLSLYPALAGYLLQKLTPQRNGAPWRNLALFPALWTLGEWARGWVLTGFPWLWGGYSQTQGPLKSLASIVGVLGLSFLLAMLAGAMALCLSRRYRSLAILLPVLALAVFIGPRVSDIERSGERLKLVLVQGNIPQSMKWQPDALWPTLLKYMDLTRPQLDADIIIWPEAAVPAPEAMVADFLENANRVANLNDSAIITGIISQAEGNFYNSLIVLGNQDEKHQDSADYREGHANRFNKHHLLPIGEFVPFESLLRPIAPLFNLPMSSFGRGDYRQPNLKALGYKVAPSICFEIAFPEQVRDNLDPDTDLLLTVSNDAWFGESNGPLQHMEIAQMRAIELGRPLARATNNGVTALVDEHGNISARLPQFEAGVLTAEVPLVTGQTWFARWGQAPVLWLCGLLFGFSLLGLRRSPKARQRRALGAKPL